MFTHQDTTLKTYQDNFEIYKEKTPNEVSGEFIDLLNTFISFLPLNSKVFELGSAQGRDARYLRNKGIEMYCTDIIPQALKELEQDNFQTSYYDFREKPKTEWFNIFDGVIAKAVFLHATQEVFEKSINNLSEIVKSGGIFCITFKLGEGEEIEREKIGGDRYFKYYSKLDLEQIIAKNSNFKILDIKETEDAKWIQLILKRN